MGEIIEEDLTPMIIFRSIGRGTQEGNDWEELEAALIVAKQQITKRKIPPNNYDSSQEDIRLIEKKGKFSYGEVMDCGDSSSFVEPMKQLDLLQVPVLEAHKASESTIWFKADGMMFNTTAKLVANAIDLVKSYIKWNRFPNLICNDARVSRSISRFVLSILDLDDICNTVPNKKQSEYRSLFCKLDPLVEDHKFSRKEINGIYMDALRYWTWKKQKRAMSCIAQELLGAEAFAGLNEVDVCSLIKFDMTPACSETSVIDWVAPYFTGKGKVTKEITDEMENFVPLKVEYKVQLNLEAAKMKCFRVIDSLFVEACKGFITKDLFEALKTLLNGSSDRARRSLSQFLEGLHMGLMRFVSFKKYMIVAYQEAVLYPLIHGPFGVLYDKEDELYREFDDEVMEVMKIADHERRMRRDRFIGVDTVLYALSLSRVRNHPLVKSVISKSSPDKPPEMPAFKIYKLAGQCATDFENEVVSLHHLALAAISVKLGDPTILHNVEHFEGLSVQKDKLDAAVVSGAALNYSGGDIMHYETLIDAILDGGLEVIDWVAPYFTGKGKVTKEITDEMENFVPLKAEYKVQLNLEAAKMQCLRVIDCLFVEACKGFITKDLFEALKTLLNGSSDRARRCLSQFLEGLHMGLMRFVSFKKYMIVAYQEAVLYPLIHGPFGVLYDKEDELYREFDDEVMEVMKIADHERRMRRDRFIGVDTILYALSLSRVRNHLLVKSVISKSSPDKPPEMPAFKIYKLAGQCATYFGNEVVSLHHLALAAISVKLGDPTVLHNVEHFEGLSVQKDKLDATVVSGAALNYSGGHIMHYETLIDAILGGGLQVPDIR